MMLLMVALLGFALAVFRGPSWTAAALTVVSGVVLVLADAPGWAVAIGGGLAVAAGLGASWVVDSVDA